MRALCPSLKTTNPQMEQDRHLEARIYNPFLWTSGPKVVCTTVNLLGFWLLVVLISVWFFSYNTLVYNLYGGLMPFRIASDIFWKYKNRCKSLISVWSQKWAPVWEHGIMRHWPTQLNKGTYNVHLLPIIAYRGLYTPIWIDRTHKDITTTKLQGKNIFLMSYHFFQPVRQFELRTELNWTLATLAFINFVGWLKLPY